MSTPEWPEVDIARLRELWTAGISTTEIGRLMRRTKNAVVGRARRLHLLGRPSPIKRDGSEPVRPYKRRIVERAGPVTLAPMGSDSFRLPVLDAAKKKAPPKPVEAPRPAVRQTNRQCEWLEGQKPFVRCTENATPGRPYCEAHSRKAYATWRSSDQEAAA